MDTSGRCSFNIHGWNEMTAKEQAAFREKWVNHYTIVAGRILQNTGRMIAYLYECPWGFAIFFEERPEYALLATIKRKIDTPAAS